MYKIMTPGPTRVKENVRLARSLACTNPDLDPAFYEFYKETCDLLAQLMHTKNQVYILGGEGILGLEAACASLTEQNDRVLVIDNGIFGRGFADFVTMYGGEAVSFISDYKQPVDINELRVFLEVDSNFKYATVVHCDTPSGVLNDIHGICNLLSEHNILTVVDSVSAMFGEEVHVDDGKIDILCGGSQKALSAPPGLTMLWVSDQAIAVMENRKTPIASFYANILLFKNYYTEKWFPYTMPISDIYGLRAAIDNVIQDQELVNRHERIARATRKAVLASGLQLYLEDGYANTVTVIQVPEGCTDQQILETMKDKYQVMIAGCFDILAGKVIRIGHMGENARLENMVEVMDAMTKTLTELGFPIQCDMTQAFLAEFNG